MGTSQRAGLAIRRLSAPASLAAFIILGVTVSSLAVPPTSARARPAGQASPALSASAAPDRLPNRNGRIVFLETVPPGGGEGRRDVFTVRRDGTGIKRLTFRREHTFARWGPFGHRILYDVTSGRGQGIWVMGAAGRHKQRLIARRHPDFAAAWAPGGRRFLFSRGAGAGTRLYVYSFATGAAKPIGSATGDYVYDADDAVWSPDGRRIAFVRPNDDDRFISDLFTIRANGTGLRRLTSTPSHYESAPDWSPNGRRLVFNRSGEFSNCSRLYTIRANGSAPARLVRAGCGSEGAAWSPDGRKFVVFRSDPRYGLWIMPVYGSPRRFLVPGAGADWQPRR